MRLIFEGTAEEINSILNKLYNTSSAPSFQKFWWEHSPITCNTVGKINNSTAKDKEYCSTTTV